MTRPPIALVVLVGLSLAVGACGKAGRNASGAASATAPARTAAVTSPTSEGREATTFPARPGGALRGDEDDDDAAVDVRRHREDETADADNDFDNDAREADKGYFDSDDRPVRDVGRPASPALRVTIARLVDVYMASARAADGAKACSLTFSLLAESIPEQWAQAPGPSYLRGLKSCAAVLSRLFAHVHARLSQPARVTSVRVEGRHALAILGSSTVPASLMEARREGSTWRIDRVMPGVLP